MGFRFQKTEDHNKLGTSAVAFTWNSARNLWCIYAQTQIYIFSFSLAAISKFLGRYMTNHIEYFSRTWVTFHNITSRRSLHILFFCNYNKNSYSLAAMKFRAVYEYGGIYCIDVTSLCFAMRRYIYNFTQLSLRSCCSILLRKNRNIILFITAKEKWWGYWCNVSCEKRSVLAHLYTRYP